MAAPSISNITLVDSSAGNTWTSGAVAGADAGFASISDTSQPGIDGDTTVPGSAQRLANDGTAVTAGLRYSAYKTFSSSYDISGAQQSLALHSASSGAVFTRLSSASDAVRVVLFSGSGQSNYAYWNLGGSGDRIYPGVFEWKPIILSGESPDGTGGAWDNSDVTGIGWVCLMASSGTFNFEMWVEQIVHIAGEVGFDDGDATTNGTVQAFVDELAADSGNSFHSLLVEKAGRGFNFGFPVRLNSDLFTDNIFSFGFRKLDGIGRDYSANGYFTFNNTPPASSSTTITDALFSAEDNTYDLTLNAGTGTISVTNTIFANAQDVDIDDSGTSITGGAIPSANSIDIADASISALSIDDCAGPVVISSQLVSGSSLSVTNPQADALQFDFNPADDSGRTYSVPGGSTVNYNPGSTGTYTHTGITRIGAGNITFDNLSANNITINVSSDVLANSATASTGGGTVTLVGPVDTFTINSSQASSTIQIFTTGTQTLLDSGTGSSLAFNHGGQTVDYVVQKAGFIPQRFTGVLLSGTSSVTVNLVASREYNASHTLTYTTDASWSRTNNELTVPTFGPSVQDVFSLMIDSFISETSLRNTAFNLEMDGANSLYLTNDAEGVNDATIENMTRGGVGYIDASGVVTAEWFGVLSVGDNTSGETGEYQQIDGSTTTDARASGNFDEIIKMYGDASHGNFDYRGHAVFKYQINGFQQVRVDVLDLFGISTLTPTLYVLPMSPIAISASAGDPAISITITDHTAAPITVGGLLFDYEVVDNGTNSAEDILREINYNNSLDATYQGKDPFNWPDIVAEEGANYATARGFVEGQDTTATLHGFYVSRGGVDHPDFARFESNTENVYYTPATVAQLSAPNLTDGRIQIVNETGRTASAWAATTAYSLYDKVLRSTGVGTESGIGLYFQCTTAGTTGGSEPTWDTTVGNTTSDGSVVWTCRAIEFDNTTTTVGYSNSWTDHEEFDNGDTIRLRWVDEDDLEISAEGVATASGTTSFLNTPEDDTVYDAYGIDGSTVTEYAADYPNVQVDVNDPDNVFYNDRFYAWYKFNLTTADGIRNFFGGVTAVNASNILINNSVVDIFFDNTKAVSARQGDNIVIQRDDGAYPQVTVTSGGGGLGFYYTGIGYTSETGVSGLTAQESADLALIGTIDTNLDEVRVRFDLDGTKPNTYANDNSSITNSDFTLTKSDNGDGTFDIVKT